MNLKYAIEKEMGSDEKLHIVGQAEGIEWEHIWFCDGETFRISRRTKTRIYSYAVQIYSLCNESGRHKNEWNEMQNIQSLVKNKLTGDFLFHSFNSVRAFVRDGKIER